MKAQAQTKKNSSQSIFDKEFKLDKKTKEAFAEVIKEAKKTKLDPSEHSRTIICGPEEFGENKKKITKSKK